MFNYEGISNLLPIVLPIGPVDYTFRLAYIHLFSLASFLTS